MGSGEQGNDSSKTSRKKKQRSSKKDGQRPWRLDQNEKSELLSEDGPRSKGRNPLSQSFEGRWGVIECGAVMIQRSSSEGTPQLKER